MPGTASAPHCGKKETSVSILCASFYAYAAAYLAGLDATGVALLSVCIFAVIAMELMNSAVERAVDKPDTTHWWSAGAAKDMAAGAVMLTAIGAVCVGVCLFGQHGRAHRHLAGRHGQPAVHCAVAGVAGACILVHIPLWAEKGERGSAGCPMIG